MHVYGGMCMRPPTKKTTNDLEVPMKSVSNDLVKNLT